jgi:threonine dehydrogenase-like Zn-dependent dehydrogenase
VLVEPVSIGVHAVLWKVPPPGAKVLVVGSGMMGYAAVAALRWLAPGVTVVQATHLPYQRDMALALGADEAHCAATDGPLAEKVAAVTGAKLLRPIIGRPVLTEGFDVVYDCVGTAASLQDAFYFTRPRGTIVLVGAPGELPGLDWTFVWARELTIVGTLGYGIEAWEGEAVRTFDLTMRLMRERPLPLASLVTHRFPLADVDGAMRANLDRAGSRSLKTVFEPGGGRR